MIWTPENGTADSITIQLNADGEPAGGGDGTYWYYSADSGCWLYNGVFALQPSSEAEAESALQAKLYISKDAEFNSGTVGGKANNYGIISGGTFQGDVYNTGTISNGTFQGGRTTSAAPSPTVPSRGFCTTTAAPSPAAPLRKLSR